MLVLGIETSCDETGVALVEGGRVLKARVATQEVHARWGGVVPELASRLHQRTLTRMVEELFEDSGCSFGDLRGVAATRGPGLIGALLVGVSHAKGIAVARNIPFAGVNHLEAHLWAAQAAGAEIPLPALALLVSGGHTELVRIDGFGEYLYLGGTLDDAAGEAFDKVGGLLGLSYPAGAEFSRLAEKGDPRALDFPVANTKNPFDFSFSGLKTAALRALQQSDSADDPTRRADFAASFEHAVVRQLVRGIDRAISSASFRCLVLTGGVAANRVLRRAAADLAKQHALELRVPPVEWCTDNGAMIACLGEMKLLRDGGDPLTIGADPNLPPAEGWKRRR